MKKILAKTTTKKENKAKKRYITKIKLKCILAHWYQNDTVDPIFNKVCFDLHRYKRMLRVPLMSNWPQIFTRCYKGVAVSCADNSRAISLSP